MENSDSLPLLIEKTLAAFFRPIARFGLRRGVGIRELTEALRVATVQAAEDELLRSEKRINRNRLSALTGLYRRDIERIQQKQKDNESSAVPASPATRILNAWENQATNRTRRGKPRLLTEAEFTALAEGVTKTVHAGTILRELVRSGAVRESGSGYELARASNSLFHGREQAFAMIADDLDRLFLAAESNLAKTDPIGHLHHRTYFDNIYADSLIHLQEWLLSEGREFHRRVREYFSQFDKDLNPSPYEERPAGGRIALSSFSYCHLDSSTGGLSGSGSDSGSEPGVAAGGVD